MGAGTLEVDMKKLALAAALSVAASTSFAGGLSAPIVEPEVIVEETSSSSSAGGIVVPLILLALIAAVAAN
jgi:hypothetical protein